MPESALLGGPKKAFYLLVDRYDFLKFHLDQVEVAINLGAKLVCISYSYLIITYLGSELLNRNNEF